MAARILQGFSGHGLRKYLRDLAVERRGLVVGLMNLQCLGGDVTEEQTDREQRCDSPLLPPRGVVGASGELTLQQIDRIGRGDIPREPGQWPVGKELDLERRELARQTDAMLLPDMAIKEAVLAFDRAEAEALAVVDSTDDRRVIGLLSEAYALRRYAAELERRRQELLGEG